MADTDTQVPESQSSAPADAPAQLDENRILELVATAVQNGIDARIPKLQSAYDSQISDLRKQVQRSNMTEEEVEEQERTDYAREVEEANQRAAIAEAALKYPNALPLYKQMMEAGTVEEQLEFLESLKSEASQSETDAGAEDEGAEAEESSAPVDPNNPRREPTLPAGSMTQEMADKILASYGEWPDRG
jgi:hypothetical protein